MTAATRGRSEAIPVSFSTIEARMIACCADTSGSPAARNSISVSSAAGKRRALVSRVRQ